MCYDENHKLFLVNEWIINNTESNVQVEQSELKHKLYYVPGNFYMVKYVTGFEKLIQKPSAAKH